MLNSRTKYFRQYYLKNREKLLDQIRQKRRKQNMVPKRVLVDCFRCEKAFFIKFVPWKDRYSLKNNWDYWTKNEAEKGKKICNNCLVDLYRNKKEEFKKSISDLNRRQILRYYSHEGCLQG